MTHRVTSDQRIVIKSAVATDFGDYSGGDYLDVSTTGVVTLAGAAKRHLTLRPEINVDEIKKQAVPVQVEVGSFFGYTMPIYAADHQHLHFKQVVPGRWDGASDAVADIFCCLSGAEDVGDYFKFQVNWEYAEVGEVVPATSHPVDVEQIVLAGRAAQYDIYKLEFAIDLDGEGATSFDLLALELRRIDATDPDVTGNIIVLDWHVHYQVDKMFTP